MANEASVATVSLGSQDGSILVAWGPQIAALAGLAGIIGLGLTIYSLRRGKRKDQSDTVDKITEKSLDLMRRVNADPDVRKVWAAEIPEADCPEANGLMREAFTIYHSIHRHRNAGTIDTTMWEAYLADMRDFVSLGYVQTNIHFADTFGAEFGKFMRGLDPKPRSL